MSEDPIVGLLSLICFALTFVFFTLLPAILFGAIFRKAGYSPVLGLLMLIPVVNLCTLVWFATTKWPIEYGARELSGPTEVDADWQMKMLLKKAMWAENTGKLLDAIKHYEEVIANSDNPHQAELARERIRGIRARLTQAGGA